MDLEDKLIQDLAAGELKRGDIAYKLAVEVSRAKTDNSFNLNTLDLDNRLVKIQNEFKKYRWDTERRLRKLSKLKSEADEIYMAYNNLNDQKGVQSGKVLKKEIKKALNGGKNIIKNKREKRSRFLKNFLASALIATCVACAAYGIFSIHSRYEGYISSQNKKVAVYQQRFDEVKTLASQGKFMLADDLSEALQKDLEEESFLSPTKKFLKEVEIYDNEVIDKGLRKNRYYYFLHNLGNAYEKAGEFLESVKDFADKHRRPLFYLGLLTFGIYLFKKL